MYAQAQYNLIVDKDIPLVVFLGKMLKVHRYSRIQVNVLSLPEPSMECMYRTYDSSEGLRYYRRSCGVCHEEVRVCCRGLPNFASITNRLHPTSFCSQS